MKHIFIVNPAAGKGKLLPSLLAKITYDCQEAGVDYEIHHTTTVGDGTKFVAEKCRENPDEPLRFYACGGDGTVNEVVNGIVSFPNAELAVVPVGTGNDFIKSFSHSENFSDISNLIAGHTMRSDVIKYNKRYSVNILNIGFDCAVVQKVEQIKRSALVPQSMSYTFGVVSTLMKNYGDRFRLTTDTGETFDGEFLLCIFANASYYGGGYKAGPLAAINDGLMDVCVVDKVPRSKFIAMIEKFKNGTMVNEMEKYPFYHYMKCKKVTFDSERPIGVCADGEISPARHLEIEVIPNALTVVVPKGSKCLASLKKPKQAKQTDQNN